LIIIVDYGMGNLGSIANMLKKVRAEAKISSKIADIEQANKIILPGVGAFDAGMQKLEELGLIAVLNNRVLEDRTPILGVCLGMQLFTQRSEEGTLPGLGWFDAETVRFKFRSDQSDLKIPHMGWNSIRISQPNPIWDDEFSEDPWFYFVHSYHVVCRNDNNILATSFNGYEFPAAIIKDNIIGTQFHPEKSHKYGMKLMKNFVENT
jgi:imidazole glycerol-phosphate synthase subunit HisH